MYLFVFKLMITQKHLKGEVYNINLKHQVLVKYKDIGFSLLYSITEFEKQTDIKKDVFS